MHNRPNQPNSTALFVIAGLTVGLFASGCAVRGTQKASVEPRGETAAIAAQNQHDDSSATNNTVRATSVKPRGNPMPTWVLAEAERLISQGSTPAKALSTAMDGNRPMISTLPVAPEETAALTDGMDGLSRISFAEEGADFDPCASRDGKTVVFASTQHRATSDIYVKSVFSRTVTQLTADPANDIMPSLSPDGKKIAFASDRAGSWKIYVMSAQGGQAVQLSNEGAHDLHPSFSPDGKRIVFCRLGQMSGRWELWVLDVMQSSAAEFIGYGMFPQWCPVASTGENGTDKILFQRGRERGDRAFGLWTVDYKSGSVSNMTEVVSSKGFAAINPTWAPDGKFLAYSSVPAAGTAQAGSKADLWIAAVDGSARVNLSAGRFSNVMPSWAGDGRVYFVSNRGGLDNIWSIATDKALAAAGAAMNNTPATANAESPASSAGTSNNSGEGLATVPTTP